MKHFQTSNILRHLLNTEYDKWKQECIKLFAEVKDNNENPSLRTTEPGIVKKIFTTEIGSDVCVKNHSRKKASKL